MKIPFTNREIKILGGEEERTSFDSGIFGPQWGNGSGGGTTKSGELITPDNALNISTVHACVKVIAETIASLPLKLYKRKVVDGKVVKELALKHPLYNVLHRRPNTTQTSLEWIEMMVTHICLRGNSYGLKEVNGLGQIVNIIPLNPASMDVDLKNGNVRYKFTWLDGKTEVFLPERILHTKGLSTDGIIGLSPVTLARESMGLAVATEGHGARLFKNDARPGGVLSMPGKLTEASAERLKNSWSAAHSGDNAFKVAVLEEDLKWTTIGFSNDDAQFLETRLFQVEDIARIYRVPSFLIGHPDKTSTYASAEQSMKSFIVHTIRPWISRLEQSMERSLLTEKEQDRYFIEFNIEALLRGDTEARTNYYASAIEHKWMNANEVREKENLNPIEGGDVYENPNTSSNSFDKGGTDGDEGDKDS